MLKPGADNTKIGGFVTKGRWRGMPIYVLTLEERKTCDPGCAQAAICFGNNMHRGFRIDHTDPAFLPTLEAEVGLMAVRHYLGFVIRPHILGDFYSVDYVQVWAKLLKRYPMMRLFGYSERPQSSEIGAAVLALRDEFPDRFRFRFSGQGEAGVIPHPLYLVGRQPHGIVCPQQTHPNITCGTCTLCWELPPEDQILFMEH